MPLVLFSFSFGETKKECRKAICTAGSSAVACFVVMFEATEDRVEIFSSAVLLQMSIALASVTDAKAMDLLILRCSLTECLYQPIANFLQDIRAVKVSGFAWMTQWLLPPLSRVLKLIVKLEASKLVAAFVAFSMISSDVAVVTS
ncbi:hypothetical protein AVEN_220206-1 [Araneus ventricosus]|uniref:Uncharacterized protein n=1 Tax=Araneus ventricosus TaxID=182803 RepID=A0A4Y2GZI2_ARAVE|nr:hypothetical protein AVEN_220206-1 [Araneus ventricosus]